MTHSNEIIDIRLYEAYIADFKNDGYNEFEAQMRTLNKLKENIDIDFWEVK